MGLRSQGVYQRELAASNNFILSSRFNSKNNRYRFFHTLHSPKCKQRRKWWNRRFKSVLGR